MALTSNLSVDESFFSDETVYEGPQISWFTPGGIGHTGYGVAALGLVLALQKKKTVVQFAGRVPYCHVSFIQPEFYKLNPHQRVIGYTPWESTLIADTWPYLMNQCDEIWTTSQFCSEVFVANGITVPVHVVPHGIDPDVWTIQEREVGGRFKFLHVGGETGRKNVQMVVDAFLDLFDGNTDIELVLKSHGASTARWKKNGEWMGNIGNHPQVTCITETFESEYDLVRLHHDAHCMVYPTMGEGFGFIPFQAIATGMPTICTNLTGCQDFADMSIPLDATWGPGYGIHLGDFAVPDPDHLRSCMQDVVDNYYAHKKKALQSAHIIHSSMTWANIADQVISILGDDITRRAQ